MHNPSEVPGYPKVLTIGSRYTEHVFHGEAVVQEKVDGSQFAFTWGDDHQLRCRSHHRQIDVENPNPMFAPAVEYLRSWENERRERGCPGVIFYCEYLQRPKHNTLAYDRLPKNHLVLFDVYSPLYGWRVPREHLEAIAEFLDIDVVPEVYRGPIASLADLEPYMSRESFLGGTTVEGVVVKNYDQTIALGGQVVPLFCKRVSRAFQERNGVEWKAKSSKGRLEAYLESFTTEARWRKAVQRMRDEGTLEDAPRDIGTLVKLVQQDVEEEEAENIKEWLYRLYIGDVKKNAVRGLAEWYRAQLESRLEEVTP